jgi:hypothetical protein
VGHFFFFFFFFIYCLAGARLTRCEVKKLEGCAWVWLFGCRLAVVSLLLLSTGRLTGRMVTWEVKKREGRQIGT